MKRFLFRFGYSTPAQWEGNRTHGWDDECSSAFFVRANSAEDALFWGCEVAECFVRNLFDSAGYRDIPSWKAAKYAFWIDENPNTEFSPTELERLPEVVINQIPDFEGWL